MTESPAIYSHTLDQIFGEAACRWPQSVAVRMGEAQATYAELDRMSDAIAAHLSRLGAGVGAVVALKLPKSVQLAAALLGVLKAGAAVLPIDPSYPSEMVGYMIERAGASVSIDPTWMEGVSPEPAAERVAARHGAADLCYVLFTSGSTGRPKGVAMPHQAIANLVGWQREAMPLEAGSRVLQFAPLSFDVSFQEFFTTWADGGTIVLIDQETRQDPKALWRAITAQEVARIFLPYVALQLLAEHAPAELPGGLRDVVTAGEALRITPQIRDLFARLPGCRLHNHYGPTETHVCTAYMLAGAPESWALLPPIGTPISGATALVLDEAGQAAATGELFVGGACLAAGYIGRPDLTAERFRDINGSRYYKTGDLVRTGRDRVLEFVGRADDQMKVRGFRVEPGEIEAQLSQHPAIRECAVTARDQRLIAYWVGEAVPSEELRAFLAQRIAAHLVPSAYIRIESMPVTPSGKIDRRNLPAPVAEPAVEAEPAAAGGTPLESKISQIWAKTLGIAAPDRRANFFDLGGTSLTAIKAQQLLGSELQQELPVTLLFQYPTIEALAQHLEEGEAPGMAARVANRASAQKAAMRKRPARPLAR